MRFLVALSLLVAAPALAQPGADEPPPPPAPVADPAQPQFDAAFDAMTRGDFATAAAAFRAVARTASDPELRGAANQLGRLADDYARKQARLSFGARLPDA